MTSVAHLMLGGLQEINLQMKKDLSHNGHYAVPGQKLCLQCKRQATIKQEDEKLCFEINIEEPVDCNIVNLEEEVQLDSASGSPYVKLISGRGYIHQETCFCPESYKTGFDTDIRMTIWVETQMKTHDLNYLVQCKKEKLKVASRRKQLEILTLAPNSLSVKKAEVFLVLKSKIQRARLLQDEKRMT